MNIVQDCSGPGAVELNGCQCAGDGVQESDGGDDFCECQEFWIRHYIQSVFGDEETIIVDECIQCSGPGAKLDVIGQEAYCSCGIDTNAGHDGDQAVCVCDVGYMVTEDGLSCVPCSGPGSELVSDECECVDGHDDDEDGVCECLVETHMTSDDSFTCIPCSGIGAHILSDTCECGENAEATDGVCNCMSEHLEWIGFHRCRPECTGDMNEFSQDFGMCVCSYDNSHVDGDDCVCDDDYEQKSDNTGCVHCVSEPPMGYGSAHLDDSFECVCDDEFSTIDDATAYCSCNENYLFNTVDLNCILCHGPFAYLDADGHCQCPAGHMLSDADNNSGECIPCSGPGAFLDDDACETTVDSDKIEFEFAVSGSGIWSCKETFYEHNGDCYLCIGPGSAWREGSAWSDGEMARENGCYCDDPFSPDSGELATDGICTCDPHNMHGDECVTCSGVGSFDESSGTCQCASDSSLSWDDTDGWMCTCNNNFYQFPATEPTECIECHEPGTFDEDSGVCECDDTTFFEENADSNGCQCMTDYHMTSDASCLPCKVGTSGAIFGMDVCICPEFAVVDDEGECQCEDDYQMSDDDECVLCLEDAEFDAKTGECTCEDDHILFEGSCVPCSGVGPHLDDDGTCTCAVDASDDEDESVCVCDENFQAHDDAFCVLCYGMGAELDSDGLCSCSITNTQFDPLEISFCMCPDMHMVPDSEDECVPCSGPGAFLKKSDCETTVDLDFIEFEVHGDGVWSCKPTYYEFEENCHLCTGPGSIWRDDACYCDDPFSENAGEEADEGMCSCGPHNEHDEQCIACNGVGTFEDGICQCVDNSYLSWDTTDGWLCTCSANFHQFPDEEPTECRECHGHGASFDSDSGDCNCEEDAFFEPNSEETGCLCMTDYHMTSTGECIPCQVGVFGALFSNDECICPEFATVDDEGECQCEDDYQMSDDDECVLCLEDAEFDAKTGECTCEDDHILFEGSCVPCSGVGPHLDDDGTCTCAVDASDDEDESVCVCDENFQAHDDAFCVLCYGMGAELDSDGLCSCSITNTQFDPLEISFCMCPDMHMVPDSEDECVPCSGPGAFLKKSDCETTVDLDFIEFEVHGDGVWSCKPTYYEFEENCHLCTGPGSIWRDDACYCDDPFSENAGEEADEGMCSCGPHNEHDEQCIACNGVGTFEDGICQCVDNSYLSWDTTDGWLCTCSANFFQFPDEEPTECRECHGYGATFDSDSGDCLCDEDAFFEPNSEDTGCLCMTDYHLASTGECIPCQVGVSGALFSNDECICPEFATVNDEGECQCEDDYQMSDDDECVLCLEDAEFDAKTGECTCEDDHILFEGSCVPCSGVGPHLDDDGTCTCAVDASDDEDESVCVCDENFQAHDDAFCVLCYGMGAELDSDGLCSCSITNTQFDPLEISFCMCPDMHMVPDSEDECVPCSGPGAFLKKSDCETTVDLDFIEFEVHGAGVWSCKPTYYELDEECHLCTGPGAVWRDDACYCDDPFSDNAGDEADKGMCTCGPHNEHDEQCIACNGVGTFENGICQCTDDAFLLWDTTDGWLCTCSANFFQFPDEEPTECRECHGYGASFDSDSGDCNCDEDAFFEPNSEDTGCQCMTDYHLTSTGECIPCQIGIFGALFTNDECLCPEFAIVNDEGECQCEEDYQMSDDDECVLCLEDAEFDAKTGECTCADDQILFEGGCVGCSGIGALDDDGDCECADNANDDETKGVCVCVDDFISFDDAFCVQCYGIGAELDSDGHCSCPADNTEFDSEANGHCICVENFQENDDGECIACYGIDAAIDGADCACKKNSVFDDSIDGYCICDAENDYMINEDNDKCIICSGIGAHAVGDKCECDESLHSVLDGGECVCNEDDFWFHMEFSVGECFQCKGIDTDTSGDTCQCVENSILNPDDDTECICDASSSYISNEDNDECIMCTGHGAMIDDNTCACDVDLFTILNTDSDGCECHEDYLPNEDGDECIKCYGVLASLDSDECVCGSAAIFNPFEVAECICNEDENYQMTEEGDDCITCYGNGAEIDGSECMCNAELNAETDPDEEGHCICMEGYLDNLAGDCLVPELNVIQTCVFNYFEENQSPSADDLEFITIALFFLDYKTLAVGELSDAINALSFDESLDQSIIDDALDSDEFASIQFITDIFLQFRDSGLALNEISELSMDSCFEAAFWSKTSIELTFVELETIVESATTDETVQTAVIASAAVQMTSIEVSTAELKKITESVLLTFDIFQLFILSFIEEHIELTAELRVSVIAGLSAFDYTALTSSTFVEVFSELKFAETVSSSIEKLVDADEFEGITVLITVLTIFVEEGVSLEELKEFETSIEVYIEEKSFWSQTSFTFVDMTAIAESTGADAALIQNVIATAASYLDDELIIVLKHLKADLNVFQLWIFTYFETTAEFTVAQQLSFATGIASFDYTTLDLTNFSDMFGELVFGSDISENVMEMSNAESFASITFIINVITAFKLADESFDIDFDISGMETWITTEFWLKTEEDIDFTILVELVESISTDVTIVNSMITQVIEVIDVDVETVLLEINAEFNIFQISIMEFISAQFISTTLTIEQQLSIAIGLSYFDFTTLTVGGFSDAFTALSFSSDETFNEEIIALSTSDPFISISLVVDILTLFVEQNVEIETMNLYAIEEFTTAEFWETTVIDSTIVFGLIESTGADATIITSVIESSITIDAVVSTELTVAIVSAFDAFQFWIFQFFINNGITDEEAQFFIALNLISFDYTTLNDDLSAALGLIELNEAVSSDVEDMISGDQFASLEFITTMLAAFIENGIDMAVLTTEMNTIETVITPILSLTSGLDFTLLSGIMDAIETADFTTEVKVRTMQTCIMFGEMATMTVDVEDFQWYGYTFTSTKLVMMSYFAVDLTDSEQVMLAIALANVDDAIFESYSAIDTELVYLDETLFATFEAGVESVTLQFAVEFITMLEENANVDMTDVAFLDALISYLETIWTETALTYEIIEGAITSLESNIETSLFIETRIQIFQAISMFDVEFDVEEFVVAITADFNIFQTIIMAFFSETQDDDLVKAQIAIGLIGFDAEAIENEVGSLETLLSALDFGEATEIVTSSQTEDNFVTIEFMVNLLSIIQQDDSIVDIEALNLLQSELETYEWLTFFNADSVTFVNLQEIVSAMTTIEEIKVSITQQAIVSMTSVFTLEDVIQEIMVTFDIFQVTIMEFFTTLDLSEEESISIAVGLVQLDTTSIALGNLQDTIEELEAQFEVDAWTTVSDSFDLDSFSVLSVVSDILFIFQSEASVDLTTLDVTTLTSATDFWSQEVDFSLVETFVTELTVDVAVQTMVIEFAVFNIAEFDLAVIILSMTETFDIYQTMIMSFFSFQVNSASDEQVEFQLAYGLSQLVFSATEELSTQISAIFTLESVLSATTAETFNSIVFAMKILEMFETEGVDLATLTIAEYFDGDFWNTEVITSDVLVESITQSGVTDTVITNAVFVSTVEYYVSTEDITIEVFSQILFMFADSLDSLEITNTLKYAVFTTLDIETEITTLLETLAIESSVSLQMVLQIVLLDAPAITDEFLVLIDTLDIFSLSTAEVTFEIFEQFAATMADSDAMYTNIEVIFADAFEFNTFQLVILSFFRFQIFTDVTVFSQIMFATSTYDYTTTTFADFTIELESVAEVTTVVEAESFGSIKFVISTLNMLIEAGADIVDLVSVEATLETEIEWTLTIVEITFAKFSTVLVSFTSETATAADVISTVTQQYSLVIMSAATLNIYQERVMSFMIEINTEYANELALGIVAADFSDNTEGEGFNVLTTVLTELATTASIDLAVFRTDILYSAQFSSIVFVYEVINILQVNGASLVELSSDVTISQAFASNIMWSFTSADITFSVFTSTVSAMSTLKTSITTITEASFNIMLDYAFVGTDLFCENNGLNIGPDDYLTTGECNCVTNAEPTVDSTTGITVCGCESGFNMVTEITGDTTARSCSSGTLTNMHN